MTTIIKLFFISILIIIYYRVFGNKKITKLNIYDFIITALVSFQYILIIYEDASFLKIFFNILLLFTLQSYLWLFNNRKINNNEIDIYSNNHLHLLNILKYRITIYELIDFLKANNYTSFKEAKHVILYKNRLLLKENSDKNTLFLITNGMINYNNLKLINKNSDWLLNNINCDYKEVVCSFFKENYLYVIKDDKLTKATS